MKKWITGALAGFFVGLYVAASVLGSIAATGVTPAMPATGLQLTSPVVVCGSFNYNGGPQSTGIAACGGTFTCTSSGTITVANTFMTANSVVLFGLKTAGSPAALVPATVTPGTGFTVTCGSGDTSVYNYIILG